MLSTATSPKRNTILRQTRRGPARNVRRVQEESAAEPASKVEALDGTAAEPEAVDIDGGPEVRPLPWREALLVRLLVDSRVHPEVHPRQLAVGKGGDHSGAAQAVLQPPQGTGEAGEAGL